MNTLQKADRSIAKSFSLSISIEEYRSASCHRLRPWFLFFHNKDQLAPCYTKGNVPEYLPVTTFLSSFFSGFLTINVTRNLTSLIIGMDFLNLGVILAYYFDQNWGTLWHKGTFLQVWQCIVPQLRKNRNENSMANWRCRKQRLNFTRKFREGIWWGKTIWQRLNFISWGSRWLQMRDTFH